MLLISESLAILLQVPAWHSQHTLALDVCQDIALMKLPPHGRCAALSNFFDHSVCASILPFDPHAKPSVRRQVGWRWGDCRLADKYDVA